jgi:N-acylneuraminate cytidylyltransferase
MRPAELSNDYTVFRDVLIHGISELEMQNRAPRFVCGLVATAPFVCVEDLKKGLMGLVGSAALFAYSVAKFEAPIQRAIRIRPDGRVELIWPENRLKRSQDMEPCFHDAAQFYWGRREAFLDSTKWIQAPHSVPVILPQERVQDIDSVEDWRHAELLYQVMKMKGLLND